MTKGIDGQEEEKSVQATHSVLLCPGKMRHIAQSVDVTSACYQYVIVEHERRGGEKIRHDIK